MWSNDFITTITEPGFSVTVESADSEPSEPEPVTEESLEAVQDELKLVKKSQLKKNPPVMNLQVKKVQMNLLVKKVQMNLLEES